MVKVIPSIIAKNFKEIEEKINLVDKYVEWIQLDVMDGQFVANTTWNNHQDLKKLKKISSKIEVHLMVKNPAEVLKNWLEVAQRVIIHWESNQIEKILLNKKIAIALNPQTPWEKIEKVIPQIDLVLFMTVNPGFSGQKFLNDVLPKIKSFHQKYPYLKIEVDGGINLETGKKCLQAGANILVANSFIFKSKNPKEAINQLSTLQV